MPRRSLELERRRAALLLGLLHEAYPDADCTLDAEDPWRLLVAAILAAQCTDARVNLVTPALFERFPDVSAFAAAEPSEIEPYIRSCGFFRNKARNIQGAARQILNCHAGEVPTNETELLAIPGVGRKIANLLIGDAFGGEAVVVDTHCKRISALLGFTKSENPAVVERDLLKVLPEDQRAAWGHLMVAHGRACCAARRPACARCTLLPLCVHASGSSAVAEETKRLWADGETRAMGRHA